MFRKIFSLILTTFLVNLVKTGDLSGGLADFTTNNPTAITVNSTAQYSVTSLNAGKLF